MSIKNLRLGFGRMMGGSGFWFVLTWKSLIFYKDKEENNEKHRISLDNLKFKHVDDSSMFAIYHSEAQKLYQDLNILELSCESPAEVASWKALLPQVQLDSQLFFPKQSRKTLDKSLV